MNNICANNMKRLIIDKFNLFLMVIKRSLKFFSGFALLLVHPQTQASECSLESQSKRETNYSLASFLT